jgi:hypothetical protein
LNVARHCKRKRMDTKRRNKKVKEGTGQTEQRVGGGKMFGTKKVD